MVRGWKVLGMPTEHAEYWLATCLTCRNPPDMSPLEALYQENRSKLDELLRNDQYFDKLLSNMRVFK